jgi:hypothetical protein
MDKSDKKILHLRTKEMWARYELRGRDVILWSVEKNEDVRPGAFRRFLPLFARHLASPDSPCEGQFYRIAIEDVMSEAVEAIMLKDGWHRGGIVPRNAFGHALLAQGKFEDPSFHLYWSEFLERYML